MKKFILLTALALMAATFAAPSYGQASVPETTAVGAKILDAPAVQMEEMYSPVQVEYSISPCSFFLQENPGTVVTTPSSGACAVRMPMLKPEDAPAYQPLYGIRLWRPSVMNVSACNPYFTAVMGMKLPRNIRNAVFLQESRRASDVPEINL